MLGALLVLASSGLIAFVLFKVAMAMLKDGYKSKHSADDVPLKVSRYWHPTNPHYRFLWLDAIDRLNKGQDIPPKVVANSIALKARLKEKWDRSYQPEPWSWMEKYQWLTN